MASPASSDLVLGPLTGGVTPAFDTPALREALAGVADRLRAADTQVLSRTGDLVVRVTLGGHDAVVKSFAPRGAVRDAAARRQGSPARRSWLHATTLRTRGVGTPAPVAFLERWADGRLAESYYISVYEGGRVGFREELIRLFRHDPTCWKLMNLLQVVADAVRGLHDAGIRHGDLGNQNILLRATGDGAWADVQFVDLNRARVQAGPLSAADRAFDVSRLFLPSDLLRVFKEMYFAQRPPKDFERIEQRLRRRFDWHSRSRAWRHPLRERARARTCDPATTYPPPEDIWIWDERSAQPVNVHRSRERNRLIPRGQPLRLAAATLAALPRAWPAYRALLAGAFAAPVDLRHRTGIAIAPHPETWPRERALLEGLGPLPVLARFHHHEDAARWDFTAGALRDLHAAGYPVAIALVQDRRAVREPASWQRFCGQVLNQTAGVAEWVQVGQAINRVKWGLWDLRDYAGLVRGVQAAAARHPGLRFMGPAVIDFEYHHVVTALRDLPAGFQFDALAHHLYVDRRGGPENRQGRFSALEKFALARALARTAPACADRLIVSEFNWPLLDGDVYSPVGSPYLFPGQVLDSPPSASEEDQARYLIRYLLLALCSGLVERVYWWRLVARGYGLVDDRDSAAWRPRPAYHALQRWLRTVGAATFTGRDAQGGYAFTQPDGGTVRLAVEHGEPVYARGA